MPKERNAFKLGLTLIVFGALLIAVLVYLAPRGGGDLTLQVRYPHTKMTTMLPPGSSVVCAGKIVGSVKAHDLAWMKNEESGYDELYSLTTIEVDSTLRLTDRCLIVPEGQLLGGMGQLVIEDVGDGELVKDGKIIDGQPAAGVAQLARTLGQQLDPNDPTSLLAMIRGQLDATDEESLLGKVHLALDDIDALTQRIRTEFDPKDKAVLIAKVHAILDNITGLTGLLRDEADASIDQAMAGRLHQTLDTLNQGLRTIVTMLEENREPLAEAVLHVRETSRILEQEIAARIAQQLDVSAPASLMAKVHVSIDRLNVALEDIRAVAGAARETIVLNKEQISRMIANLKETSDHLKAAGKEIRRNPWRLLYQPTIEEAAQANIFDAARAFSEAATRVDDAVTRLQAVAEGGGGPIPPDDPVLRTILQDLEQTFEKFSKAEAALWEQLKIN